MFYELPETEGLSPDEAKRALDAVYAQAGCDPSHPYFNRRHPQHAAMAKHVHRLHEIWALREPEPTVFDVALADAAARQESLQAEAEVEMSALADLGYEAAPVPDDVPQHIVTGLRMQRLAAQKDYDSLGPLADAQISHLTNPAARNGLWAVLADFRQAQKSRAPDLNVRAERLVEKVAQAAAKQYAGPKPHTTTKPETELEDEA